MMRRSRQRRTHQAVRLVAAMTLLVVSLAIAASPAAAAGTVRYVAPSGSDTNPGTIQAPYRTINFAIQQLRPGDTLYVRGGTYAEQVRTPVISPGRADARIKVVAYRAERPVIQGLLWLRSPSYWSINGINVTWSPQNDSDEHMVKMIDGYDWKLVNSELWGAHSFAALLVVGTQPGQPSGWRVTRNCIHDTYDTNFTNQDQLIYANTGISAGPGLIERNLLFNAPNGMGVKLGGPDPDDGGAANVMVRRNTIYSTAQNVLVSWQSHDNTITRNLLGRVGTNYSNVRGYQLTGSANVATTNAGFDAKSFLLNDPGYPGVTAGTNTFALDPQFDSTASCAGFHPGNPQAAAYGRYSP